MSALVGVTADRWRSRPGLARACRVAAFLGPVVAVTLVAILATRVLPMVADGIPQIVCWALIAGLALAGAVVTERVLSRLLPIATLLDLDIGFPSASPTRLRIASLASLRPRDADPVDLLPGGAEHDLDAAAESVLIRYATRVRQALQPRSHLERVRLLTMLLTARLGLSAEDRDRLQWALLLREIGSFRPDEHSADHLLIAWLGPWAAMLTGPFVAVTQEAQAPQIVTAAHAAAVADTYAVVSASHPYRRGIGTGHAGARLKSLGDHHLLPEAVDALLTLPEKRLRKAVGMTAGASPLVERLAPAPQPILAATAILVVLALAAKPGLPTPVEADVAAETAQVGAQASPPPGSESAERNVAGASERPTENAESADSEAGPASAARSDSRVTAFDDAEGRTGPNAGGDVSQSGASSPSKTTDTSGSSKPKPKPKPEPEPEPEPDPEPSEPAPEPEPTDPPSPGTGGGDDGGTDDGGGSGSDRAPSLSVEVPGLGLRIP